MQGRLQTLKTRYSEKVNGELDELLRLLEPRMLGAVGVQRAREAYQILHRLAGGAGSFGLDELSHEARELSLELQPMVELSVTSPEVADALERIVTEPFLARIRHLARLARGDTAADVAADSREPYLPDDRAEEAVDIPQLDPARVVLVEPDVEAAASLSSELQDYGYRVQWVQDPREISAVRATLTGEVPAAVVADASQASALVALDVQDSPSFLPVIYLSAETSFDIRYRLAELGAGGFFTRPADTAGLVDCIENQMAEQRTASRGRVMVVDDDRQRVVHRQTVLASAGLDLRLVVDPRDLLSQLAEFRPDVVLMEAWVADCDGAALARMIRLQPEWQNLSIVFVSPEPGAHDNGLDREDVLAGPLTDHALTAAIRSRCYRSRQLARRVSRDSLTGVLVPARIRQEVAREHAQARRHARHAVVAILDLDDFRQLNRDYGHPLGDTVLRGLADLLRQRLRSTDVVGRYGGEEFVVLLSDCTEEHARLVLEDIGQQFANLAFQSGRRPLQATLSIGLAELGDFRSADAALAAADQALDERKRAGKNGVTAYRRPSA